MVNERSSTSSWGMEEGSFIIYCMQFLKKCFSSFRLQVGSYKGLQRCNGGRSMYKFYSSNVGSDKGTWVGCNTWLDMFILARKLQPASNRWQCLDFSWAELTQGCMKIGSPKCWERLLWGKTWLRSNWEKKSRTIAMFSACRGQRRNSDGRRQSQDRYSTSQVCCKIVGQGPKKKTNLSSKAE